MADPTKARLRELFEYDAGAAVLNWRTRPVETFKTAPAGKIWNAHFAGTVAGSVRSDGYRQISIDGKLRNAHRLIWIYANGDIPAGMQIDHINGVRDDNRLVNLRLVTHAENGRNLCVRSDNTSGVTGVYWHKRLGKWQAQIKIAGRIKDLGIFATLKAAAAARAKAEVAFGFHPGHGKVLEKRDASSH